MKMFLSYSDFINEGLNRYPIYLACKEPFLLDLLKGEVKVKNKQIILTEDPSFDGGDIRIKFDRNKIKSQGGISFIKEFDWEFWESNYDLLSQITGYVSAKDYYRKNGWINANDAISDGGLSWAQFIQEFGLEYKIAIKKIKIEPGLIYSIESKIDLSKETEELIKKYNIKYK
jgi:hypothetical protein